MLPPYAGSQQELSPSVNVHCSNTILRAYNTSPEDAKLISDEELEALLQEVAAMPEDHVQELLRKFGK